MTDINTPIFLEGIFSIEAALKSGSRPIHALYAREYTKDYPVVKLIKAVEAQGIDVYHVPADEIDLLAQGNTHGGVIAQVGERRYVPLEALIKGVKNPFIVMLDGVEDPFNFGQSIRAFYAAGAHGLVVRPRTWNNAAGIVARSSAGASEWMPTASSETVEDAAAFFRSKGLTIAVADKTRAKPIYDVDLSGGLFLVIGGEKRGITRSFAASADLRVMIPYGRDFEASLGTTAAASVLAFEIMRQREKA
jgi:23S rRNA (guanosine2251-2'-O)-methyltransferase